MQLPFFQELEAARSVLLVGAGGGYDVYATVPLLCALRKLGKEVHLASQSFSNLRLCHGERLGDSVLVVDSGTRGPSDYFPELVLHEWLTEHGLATTIYTFGRTGVQNAAEAFRQIGQAVQPDTVILVDGGTDILMRGDEPSLGTPLEDISSLLGAHLLRGVERKYVVCLGFGVDTFHGVCHALVLENMAALIEDGGYLGAWSLCQGMEEADLYCAAVDFATQRFPLMPSIVNKSVAVSINGWFGDRHFTDRTAGSKLFLSPLMGLYWAFRLEAIVARLLYRDQVLGTDSSLALDEAIEQFRDALPQLREWDRIPY
jgi:hypothetical protein